MTEFLPYQAEVRMLRIPYCLCQAVAGTIPLCQVDTPEVAFSRSLQQRFKFQHLLMCYIIFFHGGALFIALPIVFCLSKSLVFSLSKLKSSQPRPHSSFLLDPLVQLPGSSSTVCVKDATFEPGVHTWVSGILCQLIPSDWMPPPSPCGHTQFGHYRSHQRFSIHRKTVSFTHGKHQLRLKTNPPSSDVLLDHL